MKKNSDAKKAPSKNPKNTVVNSKEKTIYNNVKDDKRKDGLFLLTSLLFLLCSVMLISIIIFYSTIKSEEEYRYFGVDENKKFSQLVSFDKPNHKTAVVSNWLAEALVVTFDFNYKNMSSHLEDESTIWFTPAGKKALIESIQSNSGYFSDVIKKQAIVQLTLRQSPIFVQGRVNPSSGRYEWIFQVPVLFTYTMNDKDPEVIDALFTLSIERVSFNKNSQGLGINKLLISR